MKFSIIFLLLSFVFWSAKSQIVIKNTESGLLLTEKGDSVLFYQTKPKSLNGKFERCNYIHPLWAADGTVLTEDFPADHLHHRGIFWAWHQININGKQICDGWELKDFVQEVTGVETEITKSGNAIIKTRVEWKSPLWQVNGESKPFIRENTVITVHQQNGNFRRIDFEMSMLSMTENLSLGGSADVKGYSGFSVRMKLPDDVSFLGKNGIVTPENIAVKSPGYVNVSGSVLKNGGRGGIVIIDNSTNPDYPQYWILRARNSMQNAAWPGNKLFPLSAKTPLVLKYTLLVYSENMTNNVIEKVLSE